MPAARDYKFLDSTIGPTIAASFSKAIFRLGFWQNEIPQKT